MKIKNNKKIIFKLLFTLKILFICWSKKKKERKHKRSHEMRIQTRTQSVEL